MFSINCLEVATVDLFPFMIVLHYVSVYYRCMQDFKIIVDFIYD